MNLKASTENKEVGNEELQSFNFSLYLSLLSSGACFAALLASALEGPKSPSRLKGLEVPENQGPLKFCVVIGGFRARDPSFEELFPKKGILTPTLHILGK